ncbi:ankyrin repeat domain-containing protein [Saccharomonospora xinjiangensis]|uniref:ankyrin repeat domain-containing protein n=1 Tax=Saccharomonospora xinjiangensis TaxID=75294 RepID=UPI00350FA785
MNLEDILRCLVEADTGQRRAELCGGRYVVVEYTGDFEPHDLDDLEEDLLEDEGDSLGAVTGEASSLYDALDAVAAAFADRYDDDPDELVGEYRDSDVDELDYEEWLDENDLPFVPLLREIRSPRRRILAYVLLGYHAPMDLVEENFTDDHYLGRAVVRFPGARFRFLLSAAPPHHEEAYAIVQLQPVGERDGALSDACRRGDVAAIEAALAGGADVNALDERGMTALHVAVAYRHVDAVSALLTAGADPRLQAEYGNAVHFAALEADLVRPSADGIEDGAHRDILRALVAAGAPVDATNLVGATLLDLAVRTLPYPEEKIRFLLDHGARSASLRDASVHALLRNLPFGTPADLRTRVNEVRFLLASGISADGALRALVNDTGYDEKEVPGDVLLELAEVLLSHGVRDTPNDDGATALSRARFWAEHGHANYEPVAERLSRETA